MVLLVPLVLRDQVQQVQQVFGVVQEQQEPQAKQEPQVLKDYQVLKEPQEHKVQQVQLDKQALLV
jgi:hypothetical protein